MGTRIQPFPGSKEVFPIGVDPMSGEEGGRIRVVSHYLLEAFRRAEVDRAYWILRPGKWDIPAYWQDGAQVGVDLGYLMAQEWARGPAFTIDQAYPFVRDAVVVVGFPDLVFAPDDAFRVLVRELIATDSEVMLGLFPSDVPEKVDMVEVGDEGRIRSIDIKNPYSEHTLAWIIAAWQPSFTEWLHQYTGAIVAASSRREGEAETQTEYHLGNAFQAALADGRDVRGTVFSEGGFLDIGTPDSLQHAMRSFAVDHDIDLKARVEPPRPS
jgi:glucose-1-phosphate thymidylyltransferase